MKCVERKDFEFPKDFTAHNFGVRVRLKGDLLKGGDARPQLALEGDSKSHQLFISQPKGDDMVIRVYAAKPPPASKTLAQVVLTQPLGKGVECTLELFAVGQCLIARVNGQTLGALDPDISADHLCRPAISNLSNDHFRDLQIVNLDSLSETEVLKALGLLPDVTQE